jgi:hypothetical protein
MTAFQAADKVAAAALAPRRPVPTTRSEAILRLPNSGIGSPSRAPRGSATSDSGHPTRRSTCGTQESLQRDPLRRSGPADRWSQPRVPQELPSTSECAYLPLVCWTKPHCSIRCFSEATRRTGRCPARLRRDARTQAALRRWSPRTTPKGRNARHARPRHRLRSSVSSR